MFSMIGARLNFEGARVLDLYAGTGALGFEALSRGAADVVFVEASLRAAHALKANLLSLGLGSQVKLMVNNVDRIPGSQLAGRPFDLVVIDPPYADVSSGALTIALNRLFRDLVFSSNALLVLEHASRDAPPLIERWSLTESRRHGDTTLSFYAPVA